MTTSHKDLFDIMFIIIKINISESKHNGLIKLDIKMCSCQLNLLDYI